MPGINATNPFLTQQPLHDLHTGSTHNIEKPLIDLDDNISQIGNNPSLPDFDEAFPDTQGFMKAMQQEKSMHALQQLQNMSHPDMMAHMSDQTPEAQAFQQFSADMNRQKLLNAAADRLNGDTIDVAMAQNKLGSKIQFG